MPKIRMLILGITRDRISILLNDIWNHIVHASYLLLLIAFKNSVHIFVLGQLSLAGLSNYCSFCPSFIPLDISIFNWTVFVFVNLVQSTRCSRLLWHYHCHSPLRFIKPPTVNNISLSDNIFYSKFLLKSIPFSTIRFVYRKRPNSPPKSVSACLTLQHQSGCGGL